MKWLVAFHVIAVVCWFAGLFYLPRLYVYHAKATVKAVAEQFKEMEYKLYHYITTPSAVITVITGLWLSLLYASKHPDHLTWLYIKYVLVAILIIYHILCGRHLKRFKEDKNQQSHVYFRFFNEVPTLLLISIVILAFVKPF